MTLSKASSAAEKDHDKAASRSCVSTVLPTAGRPSFSGRPGGHSILFTKYCSLWEAWVHVSIYVQGAVLQGSMGLFEKGEISG